MPLPFSVVSDSLDMARSTNNKSDTWLIHSIGYQLIVATLLLLCLFATEAVGQSLLDRRLSIKLTNQNLETALKQISALADVRFLYSPQLIHAERKVSISATNLPLSDILARTLTPLDIRFEVVGAQIVLQNVIPISAAITEKSIISPETAASDLQLSGIVTDEANSPLPGVSISVKGTNQGTNTNASGTYALNLGNLGRNGQLKVLIFSFVGYVRQEVVVGNQAQINVQLRPDTNSLQEVVVVGFGSQRKATLTGAISTIDGAIFDNRGAVDNPLSALQGQLPGVVITRRSAAPGRANWNFQIRGASSINGSEPLIIIDGIAISSASALNSINPNDIESMSFLKDASAAIYGARAAGGVVLVTTKRARMGTLQLQYDTSVSRKVIGPQPRLLNVQQLGQTMTEALTNDYYGVAPTTSLWYRLAQLQLNPPASGYIDLTQYNGQTIIPSSHPLNPGFGDIRDLTFFNTNWVDVLWGSTTSTQHNFSLAGRTEKSGYRISMGYMYDGSLLQWGNNSNSRYNIRLTHDYQFSKKMKLETNLSLEKNDIIQPTLYDNILGEYQQSGFPITTLTGKPYSWGTQYSPNWQAELGGENKEYNTRIYTNMRLSYQVAQKLKFVAVTGYNWLAQDTKIQQKAISWFNYLGTLQAADSPNQQNTFYQRQLVKDAYYNLNAYLEYQNTLSRHHDIALTLGTAYERDEANMYLAKVTNLANDNVPSLNLGIGDPATKSVNETQSHYAIGSYFGRFNYAYQQKLLFEVNGRYDGSSKFSANNRWRFFYGLSAGWRLSQEAFLRNKKWLDELKVRASYGRVGNQNGIRLYDYIQLLNVTATAGATSSGFPIIGTNPVVYVTPTNTLVSQNRTWENIQTANVGIDYALFTRHLSGSVDYFVKHNRTMLLGQTYPAVLGAIAPAANIGHLRTWGWETSINWRARRGQFSYQIGGSLTDNQNKLISYGGATVINQGFNNAVEGYPIGSYFGLAYAGRIQTQEQLDAYRRLAPGNNVNLPLTVYNADGTIKIPGVRLGDNMYQDLNGDGKITVPEDLTFLGRDDPRYTFAINAGLEWKGFDLSLSLQGVGQRTIFREGNWKVPFGSIFQAQSNFWLGDTWSPENPNAFYPNLSANQNGNTYNTYNYQISSWSIQNGAYIRLKNLVVGYTLPKRISQKIRLSRARIYYAGNDLAEFSNVRDGWDPEATRNVGRANSESGITRYPFFRLHTVGISLAF